MSKLRLLEQDLRYNHAPQAKIQRIDGRGTTAGRSVAICGGPTSGQFAMTEDYVSLLKGVKGERQV